MLRHIPFYGSLMGRSLSGRTNASQSHVLVYGAVEAHSMGDKGCIASNQTIATETGLSAGRVANLISEMNKAGWVTVHMNKKTNQRMLIEPRMTLHAGVNPPSRVSEPPLHASVNIEYSKENSKNTKQSNDDKKLLELLNEKTGRNFRTLPNGYKKTLSLFTLDEIAKALDNMKHSSWHSERMTELKSDYLLRATTIDDMLTRKSSQERDWFMKAKEQGYGVI